MYIFVWYVLPILLIVFTAFLPTIRRLLEKRAKEIKTESELVEKFTKNASRFLRETDSDQHAEMREMIVWTGAYMVKDSDLIKGIIFKSNEVGQPIDPKAKVRIGETVDSLSQAARHSFSRAIAYALIISSYQSPRHGHKYRSMLSLIFGGNHNGRPPEVKDPERMVRRYRDQKLLSMPKIHREKAEAA